jgi:flagellar motor switch protein FliN/FliY
MWDEEDEEGDAEDAGAANASSGAGFRATEPGQSPAASEAGAEPAAAMEPAPNAAPDDCRRLDFVRDIPLSLTVEVGRTKMTIGELLALGPGSLVPLAKAADEPLEIFINDRLVARGEAVIVNDRLAVRLTEVVGNSEQ